MLPSHNLLCACVNRYLCCLFQNLSCSVPKEPGLTMSGKPLSPWLCLAMLVWRKDPQRGAHCCCVPQRRLAADGERAPVLSREDTLQALLPRRAQPSIKVEDPGQKGASSTACGWLTWRRLSLKWVRCSPCTNTGLSPAPPKYTDNWRQPLPQNRFGELCLLLPQRWDFMPCQQQSSGRDAGGLALGSCSFTAMSTTCQHLPTSSH